MKALGHKWIDVLKLDVEGAEYAALEDMYRSSVCPGQILVEFHHRFPGVGVRRSSKAIGMLQRMEYRIFSVSANKGVLLCPKARLRIAKNTGCMARCA